MKALVCDRCGGRINPDTLICDYCDTPYVMEEATQTNTVTITMENVMTPNEIRKMLGLRRIDDGSTITAYDGFGNRIATFERRIL